MQCSLADARSFLKQMQKRIMVSAVWTSHTLIANYTKPPFVNTLGGEQYEFARWSAFVGAPIHCHQVLQWQ